MGKITPCLWFDTEAEPAVNHYVSIFKNSRIKEVSRFSEGGPRPAGMVMTIMFELDGQEFMALNGGPEFKFTEAISLMVDCKSQREVDELWEKLGAGGQPGQCGWLKDKFGVSWQIVPDALAGLMGSDDADKAQRVTRALMQMTKIDIAALQRAHDGGDDPIAR
jgi:predicted 3-demethylubiquinone-9 3-methyltransferase (glyoxalase superfamily)